MINWHFFYLAIKHKISRTNLINSMRNNTAKEFNCLTNGGLVLMPRYYSYVLSLCCLLDLFSDTIIVIIVKVNVISMSNYSTTFTKSIYHVKHCLNIDWLRWLPSYIAYIIIKLNCIIGYNSYIWKSIKFIKSKILFHFSYIMIASNNYYLFKFH